ncbi:MAG: hypothetical protein COB76_06100 [Alphaproteobacteria bacterium]|nr:MAG: hypothetical protein COB76_06100 [Alphaproteobacteria bacterium]
MSSQTKEKIVFKGHRQYTKEDSAKLIDWKAYAKGNQLLIKEYLMILKKFIKFVIKNAGNLTAWGMFRPLSNAMTVCGYKKI